MKKAELIEVVARITGQSNRDVEEILNTTLQVIQDTMVAGQEVKLVGFGKFSARIRKGRLGINPQNPSKKMPQPSILTSKFKAGSALKKALRSIK